MFETEFNANHGTAVNVAPDLQRITANNRGPMTFKGTNTYLVGSESIVIVDPGPADDLHFRAIDQAVGGRAVSHILLTHTHRDHTALTKRLEEHFQVPVGGCDAHRSARLLSDGETNRLEAANDHDYAPHFVLKDGDCLDDAETRIEAVATPGHTHNHLCYVIGDNGIVLTGDHIMGWATTVVAPPDGSMTAYMASLDKMLGRKDRLYFPGHGGEIRKPMQFVRGIKAHRRMRERAILERLVQGDTTIAEVVANTYRDTDKRLHGAAGLSVFAHLEDMVARNLVDCDGPVLLEAHYTPAGRIRA